MEFGTGFESLWNRFGDFTIPATQPNTCIFAKEFSGWVSELLAKAKNDPSIVFVNQAKVLLLDKYFEWRNSVPKSHRVRTGGVGHACVFQVFEQAYASLRVIELALTPPMLFIPPPPLPLPSPPPPPQIAGIFLGQVDKS